MTTGNFRTFRAAQTLLRGLFRFMRDRRGNIGVMTALIIVPLVGAFGLATEASAWFLINRAAQHAADSAALAAATNNDVAGNPAATGYIFEAKAVTSDYGFTDGSNNTSVSVSYGNIAALPSCVSAKCYQVSVSHSFPLVLSSIVGYNGDVAIGGGRGTNIQAVAVAAQTNKVTDYCDLSLGGGGKKGNAITLNGVSKSQTCTFRSEGDVVCNGNNSGVFNIVYYDMYSATKCNNPQPSGTPVSDPYAPGNCTAGVDCYGSQIPPNTCTNPTLASSYPQETKVKGKLTAAPQNQLSGNVTWPAVQVICGDAQLTNNLTVTTPANGTVLLIENGILDLNGMTLLSAAGSGLTIVFSGPSIAGFTPSHIPADNGGGGVLNIAAPKSAGIYNWKGVAIWQDANLTSGVDISYSGNSPTWDITGIVYLPNSNVTVSGSVNQATNGLNCFVLIDETLLISGTGYLYSSESQCNAAGVTPPKGLGPNGAVLVY